MLLPMVLYQNLSQGPPNTILQIAVKNNQQPVWYFNDKISLHVFFSEDGKMERTSFLEVTDCRLLRMLNESVLRVLFELLIQVLRLNFFPF